MLGPFSPATPMHATPKWNIRGRKVGGTAPCLIIAEAGVNHNGNADLAEEMIRQAQWAGADCIKFQTFEPEQLVTASSPKATYQLKTTDPRESQLEMLRKLVLPAEAYRRLMRLCENLGLLFLSTPYRIGDVEFLRGLGIDWFKVASGQIVETPLLKRLAELRKPVIMSTGMSTLTEVASAVRLFRECGNERFALLQCTTDYPANIHDANILSMVSMREEFGALVGYSDHTQTPSACLAAAALGAKIIEKHFTLDKKMPGPDQMCSADPEEFSRLVRSVREIEAALGSPNKQPTPAESRNAKSMRCSIVAAVDIPAGTVLTEPLLTLKRPNTGLPARDWDNVLGRKTKVAISKDSMLRWEHLQS